MLDLEPIKRRIMLATPGPWWASKDKSFGMYLAVAVVGCIEVLAQYDGYRCSDDDDADLIANAPADLVALVAEVERLRGAIKEHREKLTADPIMDLAIDLADTELWKVLDAQPA